MGLGTTEDCADSRGDEQNHFSAVEGTGATWFLF